MSSVEDLRARFDELLDRDPTTPNEVINSGLVLIRLVAEAVHEGYGSQLA